MNNVRYVTTAEGRVHFTRGRLKSQISLKTIRRQRKKTSLRPLSSRGSANMAPISIKTVLISESVDPCCKSILEENGIRVTEKQNMKKDELIAEIKVSLFAKRSSRGGYTRLLFQKLSVSNCRSPPRFSAQTVLKPSAGACLHAYVWSAHGAPYFTLITPVFGRLKVWIQKRAPPLADATHPFFFSCCLSGEPHALQSKEPLSFAHVSAGMNDAHCCAQNYISLIALVSQTAESNYYFFSNSVMNHVVFAQLVHLRIKMTVTCSRITVYSHKKKSNVITWLQINGSSCRLQPVVSTKGRSWKSFDH